MLSADNLDLIFESIGNYIEIGHGDELQPYFEPIVEAIDSGKYQRIAIKACHAVGKTFTLARILDAIMGSYNDVKIISTAPTYRQVHDLLWKELETAYRNKIPDLQRGRLNETELWINSETFARGFSPQKSAKAESGQGTDSVFQGYHGKFMTGVIFDEATGVEHQLWNQAEGLLTSGHRVLFIVIANPTSRNCDFFKCFNNRLWKTFSINCFDSPNLQAAGIKCLNDIEKEVEIINNLGDEEALERLSSYPCPVPYLINTRWVIEKAIDWGVEHSLFRGKVLGEFPFIDSDILISDQDILNSWERESADLSKEIIGYFGLDVARFGVDKSVLTSLVGNSQQGVKSMAKQDTNQVCGYALTFIEDHKKRFPRIQRWRLAIDGGFGHGVIDRIRELQKDKNEKRAYRILRDVEILEINFGSSDWTLFHTGWKAEGVTEQQKQTRTHKEKALKIQEDRENYVNFKAKMFDLLAKDVKERLKLLKMEVYKNQLPTIKTDVDSKGRLKIESKEKYKQRTGENSPDEADSLALANFARYFAIKSISLAEALKFAKLRGDKELDKLSEFYMKFNQSPRRYKK